MRDPQQLKEQKLSLVQEDKVAVEEEILQRNIKVRAQEIINNKKLSQRSFLSYKEGSKN